MSLHYGANLRAKLTIHSLRRTAPSWLLAAGRPMPKVQEILSATPTPR